MGDDPSEAKSGEAVCLGNGAERQCTRVGVDAGGDCVVVDVKSSEDLVTEQPCVVLGGELDDALQRYPGDTGAGRVVRRVDVDQPGTGAQQLLE